MTDFPGLLKRLAESGTHFILVGGAAATAHGSARLTQDLDILYQRSPENLVRLARAVQDLHPYPRGAPEGLPFRWDEQTLANGLNFTLVTDLGWLDLLGQIAGGNYDSLLPFTLELKLYGYPCRCLQLPKLIEVKRAAGRPKDFEAIAELEALYEDSA